MKNEQTNNTQECPSCWGRQQYDGKEFRPVFRAVINGKNVDNQIGWINAYVQKYLDKPHHKGRKHSMLSPISYEQI